MTTPRFVACRCTHSHHDHTTEGFAPQCTAQHCTCLQYRPASATAGAATPIRPNPPLSVQGERPPTVDDVLRAGKRSAYPRTVKLTEKIAVLVHDLRGRLQDEREAAEASRVAEAAKVAQRTKVAELERQLADAKAALRGTPKPTPTVAATGSHACTRSGCDRTFASKQARAMHERRAHDGFNPNKAAS